MIDPLAAMRAACLAVSEGEANEIEMEWRRPTDALGENEETLLITVRREVRHINVQRQEDP